MNKMCSESSVQAVGGPEEFQRNTGDRIPIFYFKGMPWKNKSVILPGYFGFCFVLLSSAQEAGMRGGVMPATLDQQN